MGGVTPIILAAGDSSRMGYPKALLPLGKDVFLTRILDTTKQLGLAAPRVVLGNQVEAIRPSLRGYRAVIVLNPDPERGQGSSIRLALNKLDRWANAVLIWPVDQPIVSSGLVRELLELFYHSGTSLAMPRCHGVPGHPAVFGRALIEDMLSSALDMNPKVIVARYKSGAAWLDTEETGTVEDIDTPEDYRRIVGESLDAVWSRMKC